jgi:drug/metabolite transporter (DMT)-like permease
VGILSRFAEAEHTSRPLARERPLVGYGLVVAGALFGGVNASVAKIVILSADLPAIRLAQLRAAVAALLLLAGLVLVRRGRLLPTRRQLPFLALFGVVGLAITQFTYLVSVYRLEIGVALLIVNMAVVLVAVWGRFVGNERIRGRLWIAIVLALGGLALVVEAWQGATLDGLGVGAAIASALGYTIYILMANRNAGRGGHASVLVAWGFVFATVFWAIVQPWWTFPFGVLTGETSLAGRLADETAPVALLLVYLVIFGTVGVFVLYAAALRYIPPTHVVVAAVLEPVFGALVAFAWLAETLSPFQVAGGVLVLAAVLLGQSARERAPAVAGEGARVGGP